MSKNTQNTATQNTENTAKALTVDEKREKMFKDFIETVSKSKVKEVQNIEVIADYVGMKEIAPKEWIQIDSKGHPTTSKSRDTFELAHVLYKDTGKQAFYIYFNTRTIQFKVTPKVESGLFQFLGIENETQLEIPHTWGKHHEHRKYTFDLSKVKMTDVVKVFGYMLKGITTYNKSIATQSEKKTTQSEKEEVKEA